MIEVERWESRVPVYETREEVWSVRDPSGGRFSRPIRDVFHRNDRGADITVVTDYLEWNTSRMDPGLFRPPPPTARCAPHPAGGDASVFVGMEHRNTLHFNPLHAPKLAEGDAPSAYEYLASPLAAASAAEQRRLNERIRTAPDANR